MTTVHICRATGEHYVAQTRPFGCRKWTTEKKTNSYKVALQTAVRGIEQGAKRARVLLCADWYDPTILVEMKRC